MSRGGARKGAGRPVGQGKFAVPTKPIRVPENMVEEIYSFINFKGYKLPLYDCSVSAGFPSPADDHMDLKIDLNEHLIQHPTATFFVRVAGDSMTGVGIEEGDLLVVDRSLEAKSGRIVIAAVDGMLTVKRLHKADGNISLVAENPKYKPIEITEVNDALVWGVVTNVVKSMI